MLIDVGNLSFEVKEGDLKEIFANYGTVNRVQRPTGRETEKMRGFAFVELGTQAEEATAIESLDGVQWMGREIKVNQARPRESRSPSRGDWSNNTRSLRRNSYN
jgi:RNA recognition motif-containing protein